MILRQRECRNILVTLPKWSDLPSRSACWELILRYVLTQTYEILRYMRIDENQRTEQFAGFASDYAQTSTVKRGLRINVIGFACHFKNRIPKMFAYSYDINGGPVTSWHDLVSLLLHLHQVVIPDGGTCPGLAIEKNVLEVERLSPREYPIQITILVSDGVFARSARQEVSGLKAYSVFRVAIGIAVVNDGSNHGLSPEQIAIQRRQLQQFVGSRNEHLFHDLTEGGWALLPKVAEIIGQEVQLFLATEPALPRGTWCGWRTRQGCARDNWHNRNCRWKKNKNKCYTR